MDLFGRSLVRDGDFDRAEVTYLLDLARSLRTAKRAGAEAQHLAKKNIALVFEKTSTRTRCAFEVGAADQGARAVYLGPGETQLGYKESARDTARVLGRMFDAIELRGHAQADVETFALAAGVPVWNGLSDDWHPTQLLADLLTMTDHTQRDPHELSVCFVGDGANNTCASLVTTGALMGMDVRVASPPTRRPADDVWERAGALARASGGELTATDDVGPAVCGVDFVYTDVWLSLGEPLELWDERIALLAPYRVDAALLGASKNPAVKLLHCLPAFHDTETAIGAEVKLRHGLDSMEVTDEVFESPACLAFDQAENRLHTIKALMVATLAGDVGAPGAG